VVQFGKEEQRCQSANGTSHHSAVCGNATQQQTSSKQPASSCVNDGGVPSSSQLKAADLEAPRACDDARPSRITCTDLACSLCGVCGGDSLRRPSASSATKNTVTGVTPFPMNLAETCGFRACLPAVSDAESRMGLLDRWPRDRRVHRRRTGNRGAILGAPAKSPGRRFARPRCPVTLTSSLTYYARTSCSTRMRSRRHVSSTSIRALPWVVLTAPAGTNVGGHGEMGVEMVIPGSPGAGVSRCGVSWNCDWLRER
jgi:hypothetical protein